MNVVRAAVTHAVERAGYPLFLHAAERRLTAVLPGGEGTEFVRRLATEWAAPHGG